MCLVLNLVNIALLPYAYVRILIQNNYTFSMTWSGVCMENSALRVSVLFT